MFYQLKPELTLGECRSLRVRAGRSFQPNIPTYTCKSSSQSKQLNTICQAGVDTQVAELFQESNHQFWKKKIMTIEKPLRNSMTETWPISCFYERNILYSIIIQFNPKRRFMHMRNNTGMMKIHASKICKKKYFEGLGVNASAGQLSVLSVLSLESGIPMWDFRGAREPWWDWVHSIKSCYYAVVVGPWSEGKRGSLWTLI